MCTGELMGKTRVRPVIKTVHAVREYRYQSLTAVQFVHSHFLVPRLVVKEGQFDHLQIHHVKRQGF